MVALATASEADQPDDPASRAGLSPREREVLRLLVDGRSNAEIADALFIGVRTARAHVANILAKLGVRRALPPRPTPFATGSSDSGDLPPVRIGPSANGPASARIGHPADAPCARLGASCPRPLRSDGTQPPTRGTTRRTRMHAVLTTVQSTAELDALVVELTADPAFCEFPIQHYGVLEKSSRMTGTPQPVIA